MVWSGSTPAISALEKVPRKREYIVRLTDGTEMRATEEDVARLGLAEGAVLDAGTAREIRRSYERTGAREAALRLIKVRPRTEGEIRRGLAARRFDQKAVREVVDELKRACMIDDRLFAELWINEKVKRGLSGRRRIAEDLKRKGVAPDVVEAETERLLDDRTLAEAARALVVKRAARLGGFPPAERRRRVYQYLLRRGFDSETASWAVAGALGSDQTEERE